MASQKPKTMSSHAVSALMVQMFQLRLSGFVATETQWMSVSGIIIEMIKIHSFIYFYMNECIFYIHSCMNEYISTFRKWKYCVSCNL